MVEWLRDGGNPPPDNEEVTIGKPVVVKGATGSAVPGSVRAAR